MHFHSEITSMCTPKIDNTNSKDKKQSQLQDKSITAVVIKRRNQQRNQILFHLNVSMSTVHDCDLFIIFVLTHHSEKKERAALNYKKNLWSGRLWWKIWTNIWQVCVEITNSWHLLETPVHFINKYGQEPPQKKAIWLAWQTTKHRSFPARFSCSLITNCFKANSVINFKGRFCKHFSSAYLKA